MYLAFSCNVQVSVDSPHKRAILAKNRTVEECFCRRLQILPLAGKFPSIKHSLQFCLLMSMMQLANTVPDTRKLHRFLSDVLPPVLGTSKNPLLQKIRTREQFINDATAALKLAPMAIRLTPHLLSAIDWRNPLDDPIRRQFLPLASGIVPDHKALTLDSLNEQADSRKTHILDRTQMC